MAVILNAKDLLDKLDNEEIVPGLTMYHRACYMEIYKRTEAAKRGQESISEENTKIESRVLAEIVMFMEEQHLLKNSAPVFKLAEIVNMYKFWLQQYGIYNESRINISLY